MKCRDGSTPIHILNFTKFTELNKINTTVTKDLISNRNKPRFLYDCISPLNLSLVLVPIEKLYPTLETAFHQIAKHVEVSQQHILRCASYFQLSSLVSVL